MTDLGALARKTSSEAIGINDTGQVVGYSGTNWDTVHAFLYSNGQMTDLGMLLGAYSESEAFDINDAGQVVGYYMTSYGRHHAFLYSNGQMADLGSLPGTTGSSEAYGINNAGQVVGYSNTASGGQDAFLYSNGQMIDLNTLLPPNSGWVLRVAWAINNNGQIVGVGEHNGAERAFLLNLSNTTLPDIVMNSVTTTDSKSVTFNYSVENADVGKPFDVAIYRATTNQFNPSDPNSASDYQKVADVTISADNATVGTYTPPPVPIAGGLPPEPSHPYVLAVADPSGTVQESDSANNGNNTAFFRIYTVAFVVPGFGYSATDAPPDWVTAMDIALEQEADYDSALPFMWDSGKFYNPASWNPQNLTNAEAELAQEVQAVASSYPANSVVDVNLIGHSRRTEVVAGVSQLLQNTTVPQLKDGYLEAILLDPHPANNRYNPLSRSRPTSVTCPSTTSKPPGMKSPVIYKKVFSTFGACHLRISKLTIR